MKSHGCEEYGKAFVNKTIPLKHTELGHHLETHHLCKVCGNTFVDSGELEKHEQNHTESNELIQLSGGKTSVWYILHQIKHKSPYQ